MIECYFRMCPYHEQWIYGDEAEPFCTLDICTATERDIERYREYRKKELEDCNVDGE